MEDKTEVVVTLDTEQERKADLTLLSMMEQVNIDANIKDKKKKRCEILNYFGISIGEYRRLVRKYRYVLKRYRQKMGTYKGEFDDVKEPEVSQYDIQRAHQFIDAFIKKGFNI